MDPLELQKVLHFAFDMIKAGTTHWDIRELNNIIKEPAAKNHLLTGIEEMSAKLPINNNEEPSSSVSISDKTDKLIKSEDPEDDEMESSEELSNDSESTSGVDESPVINLFEESSETASAVQQKNKPLKLLTTALTNLQNVDLDSPALKEQKARELINEIVLIVQNLKQLTENE